MEAIRYALQAKGYQILVARDGNQGLAMAEREDPDLVILDMMMPKRSGFLVLERLRRTRPVPMRVIMTQTTFIKIQEYNDFEDKEEQAEVWDGMLHILKETVGG